MMYKQKKISKFALVCCSFMIALSTMLAVNPSWISNVYDTTLCASSTAPTIDSTYFDYKDNNLTTLYDGYIVFYGVSAQNLPLMSVNNFTGGGFNFSDASTGFDFYHYTFNADNGTVSLQYSLTNQSVSRNLVNFTFANIADFYNYSNRIEYKGVLGGNYSHLFIFGVPNVKYCVYLDYSLYSQYLAYQEGLADGDNYDTAYQDGYSAGQSDGYNSGYAAGNSAGVTQGQNNVINNPNNYDLFTQSQYESNYTNGYNDGFNAGIIQGQNNVINNPGQYGLYTQSQYESNYTNGYNDGINNVVSNPGQYNLYTQSQYDQNYQDGVESTTNYQDGLANGIMQGQNNVINNPGQYGLYTQSQYESNYTSGYDFATNLAKYGFTFESDLYVQLTDQAELVPISYYYYENGIKLTQESIDYITNNFIVSNNFIKFKLVAKHDLYILYPTFNFFENGVTQNTIDTFYGSAKYVDPPINYLVSMSFNYNSVNRNGIVTGNNVADFNPASYRGSDWTGTITQQNINTDLYNVTLYNYGSDHLFETYNTLEFGFDFNSADLSRLFISDYNQSYINGYEDGRTMINSNAYNEGYDKGYDIAYNLSYSNAYNEGKSDGINSANQYSFYSLISSVVDAPLNMFKSMFNFEFLGINLFNFFTSIFTLCLVIFIISKILKK